MTIIIVVNNSIYNDDNNDNDNKNDNANVRIVNVFQNGYDNLLTFFILHLLFLTYLQQLFTLYFNDIKTNVKII